MKKSLLISIVSVLTILALVSYKLISNKKELNDSIYKADTSAAISISWEEVKMENIRPSYTFSGLFEPFKEVQLFPERSGRVTRSNIDLGTYITKGNLIASIDNEEIRLQLSDNQDLYKDALLTYERNKVLAEGEAISGNALEKSELALKNAKNRVDILIKQLSYLNVYAPISGNITYKNFEIGSIVSPGMPLATVTDISSVKLNIQVPENIVTQLQTGKTIEISCDALANKKFTGIVDYVALKADDSKNFTVKIKVENSSSNPIRSGMFGRAYFKTTDTISTIVISRNSIVGSTKNPQVYLIKNGIAVLSSIKIGRIFDDKIEVLEGLKEGDTIANNGLVNLSNGVKVKKSN